MTLDARHPVETHTPATFEKTWDVHPSPWAWLSAVNNQVIGVRFMLTSLVFFFIGGFLALLIRLQVMVPDNTLIDADLFNQLFTMHGSTMMFLFVVPFIEGLALYLIPLMIGSRDVAFPRLTAFSYWVYLFGGLVFYATFLIGTVPDVGWFAYTPLSGATYRGLSVDFWLLGLALAEVAGITAGIEIVVSILKLRATGMTITRMPIFIWAMLVAGCMVIVAFTTLLTATTMLELDRAFGMRFFDPDFGGSSLLWQHLFWFFGHPEVYIMFLPATGVVSAIVVTFARRGIATYNLVTMALVVTGFVSFGLWAHHMFTTGLPDLSMSFFTASSLMISVASGVQIFAWIATVWGTRPEMKVPFLYVLGFILIFVPGGMTGVMIAAVPFNWQVHDTYFIVAHFHYVLVGGVVFPLVAGLYYWFPKFTGRMMDERLGKWSFWLTLLGFNIAFLPLHLTGLYGMARRVYTYPEELGIGSLNFISTLGSLVLAVGFLLTAVNAFLSLRRKMDAGDNPWQASSLEWSMPSPPPIYSYRKPPVVLSRQPLCDKPLLDNPQQKIIDAFDAKPVGWRASLCTDAVTAQPQAVQSLAGPSFYPLYAAIGLLVAAVGFLAKTYALSIVGTLGSAVAVFLWLMPDKKRIRLIEDDPIRLSSGLAVFATGKESVSWWGALSTLVVLSTVLATLLFSYFYLQLFSEVWPQGNLPRPNYAIGVLIVACSSLLPLGEWWQQLSVRSLNAKRAMAAGLISAFGAVPVVILCMVGPTTGGFFLDENAYASAFYLLHYALVAIFVLHVLMKLTLVFSMSRTKDYGPMLPLMIQISGMLAWFSFIAAVIVMGVVYGSPYLLT